MDGKPVGSWGGTRPELLCIPGGRSGPAVSKSAYVNPPERPARPHPRSQMRAVFCAGAAPETRPAFPGGGLPFGSADRRPTPAILSFLPDPTSAPPCPRGEADKLWDNPLRVTYQAPFEAGQLITARLGPLLPFTRL